VCQLACCSGRVSKKGKTGVIIPLHKKGDRSKTAFLSLAFTKKVYAKCLEKDAAK